MMMYSAAWASGAQEPPHDVADARGARDEHDLLQLLSRKVVDERAKSAERIARLLEEQFIADGWPIGRNYGCEVELSRHYRLSRPILREVARILEARGTARARRGRRGGLELTAPSREAVFECIGAYCYFKGASRHHLRATRMLLERVGASIAAQNPVLGFFSDCLDRLLDRSSAVVGHDVILPGDKSPQRTRAQRIARDLISRAVPGPWQNGLAIGNELDLCESYEVDRRVMRQAIRILEAFEMATSLPGRGHGLVTRSPGPASVTRLMSCYFAANRFTRQEACEAFEWLSVEMIARATRCSPADKLELIRASLAALDKRSDAPLFIQMPALGCQQRGRASNPVLELLLRSARVFVGWSETSH